MMLDEFPHADYLVYLNHAGVGVWPKRTAETVKAFAQENVAEGPIHYDRWIRKETELREQLRRLINAPSKDDIALLKNTSEALSVVAYGIDWQAGDNIVSSTQEFPSNRIVWESLQDRGVEVRLADLDSGSSPEDSVMALVDQHTRLIAVSSVQYASGLRLDLKTLGEFCRAHDILFCVDAIQSIGATVFDAQAIQADFVAADGHKWMLGPEGVALFYCREELRGQLKLRQYGWHMVETAGDYNQASWQPARSARRFEAGSPNMLGVHALSASLSLLLEIGMGKVEQQLLERSAYIIERLSASDDFTLLSPTQAGRYAGIINCKHQTMDSALLVPELKKRHIYCAVRGGGVRLSPHFYTPMNKLERTVDTLIELATA